MIDEEMIKVVADKISHDTIAFAVYMINGGEYLHFIIASKNEVESEKLYEISHNISTMLNQKVEVLDIRKFSISEKVKILSRAELVHTEDEFEQRLLETETFLAYQMHDRERSHMLDRKKISGVFYLQ